MASALERAAAEWQLALAVRDRTQRRVLLARWRAVERDLDRRLRAIERRIAAARVRGESPGITALYERGRLHELREQVAREIAAFADVAAARVARDQAAGAREAVRFSERFLREHLGAGARLPRLRVDVVQVAVAQQAPGGPLATLMGELGPQAAQAIGDGLTTGIATGQHPTVIARRIREHVVPTYRGRALTIARTETMRAVREATRQRYLAAGRLLTGWVWMSSMDRRTCPACWAMHGTRHPPDATMDGHPGCRCVMAPDVAGSTLDYGPTGEEAFAALPADTQRVILGPGRHDRYRRGDLILADMVQRPYSARWGTMRRVGSIADAERAAALRRAARTTRAA